VADFLRNLVARSLDQAPAIRPRLASIFEPVPADPALDRQLFGTEPLDASLLDENLAQEAPPAQSRTRPSRQRLLPPQIESAEQATDRGATPAPYRERHNPAATIMPPSEATAQVVRMPRAMGQGEPPQLSNGAPQTPTPASAAPTPPLVVSATPLLPAPQQRAPSALPAPPRIAAPQPGARAPQAEQQLSSPASSSHTIIERMIEREARIANRQLVPLSPAPNPAQPEAARPSPAAEQPQATPTINITIGRIDVRATTEARPKQQRSGPEVMSLDEYLRRRSGGGAR
jgi:hypothetical protein